MYRYPIGAESLEFPRGAVEPDESVTDAAARELSEETGPSTALTAAEMSDLARRGDITCALTIAAFVQALPYVGDSA